MAIGNADFTNDAKKGMGWFYNNDHTANWADYESKVIVHWEAQGVEWNKQRGRTRQPFSDETREKIRIAALNRGPHTEEWKAKIRMAMKSKEVRKKMIAAQGLRRARERGDNAVG